MRSISRRYTGLEEPLSALLAPAMALERRLDPNVSLTGEARDLYFRSESPIGGDRLACPAAFMIGCRAGEERANDLAALAERRRGLSDEEKEKLFIGYLLEIGYQMPAAEDYSGADFAGKLRLFGVSPELFVKLTDLYENFDRHITALEKLLAPAAAIIEENEALYAEGIARIEKAIDECGSVSAYMRREQLFVEKEPANALFHPSVFAPDVVRVRYGLDGNADIVIGLGAKELRELMYHVCDPARMAMLLRALGDETRLMIFKRILEKPMYGLEIAETFALSAPTISYHMGKLVASGLVDSYLDKGRSYYRAHREYCRELMRGFDAFMLGAEMQEH